MSDTSKSEFRHGLGTVMHNGPNYSRKLVSQSQSSRYLTNKRKKEDKLFNQKPKVQEAFDQRFERYLNQLLEMDGMQPIETVKIQSSKKMQTIPSENFFEIKDQSFLMGRSKSQAKLTQN